MAFTYLRKHARAHSQAHCARYDGKNWISDFVQRDFWPGAAYAKEKPDYVVYRY